MKMKILLIVLLFSMSNTTGVPQADLDLIRGLLDGSGLNLNLKSGSCENDFNSFSLNSSDLLQAILDKDEAKIFDSLDQTIKAISALSTCMRTDEHLQDLLQKAEKVIQNPQTFLLRVLNKMLTMHIIFELWGVKQKIKRRKIL